MQAVPSNSIEQIYIHAMVQRLETSAADKPVLRYKDRDIGAADFLKSIYRYARALLSQGIDRTKLVALLAPNSPDAIAIRYAANLIGAAASYLSAPAIEDARRTLIEQIKPDLLVVFPETLRLLPSGLDTTTLAVGECGPAFRRIDLIAAEQSHSPLPCEARPCDLAVVISSGGSAGVPKGSCRDFSTYTRLVAVPSTADRRQLVNGHLAYLSEVLVDITLLSAGVVILRDEFEAEDTVRQIETQRITDLFLVEPQLFELMDCRNVERSDLSSLRNLVHVGASAPPTLRARANERLGPIIAHTYGASEAGLVSLLPADGQSIALPELLTCAGRILPGVDVRFRKRDGTLALREEVGTIEVRSPGIAQGYRNRPDLTEKAFNEGWYLSGDIGYLDQNSYLHVLGRAGDIEWRDDGRLITLTDIEETLCRMSSVRYAVVVRCRDQARRIAAIESWSGRAIVEEDCLRAVADVCGPEVARSLRIIKVDKVPRSEQGKPDRMAIEQLAESGCRKLK